MITSYLYENLERMQQGNGGLAKKGSVSVIGKRKPKKVTLSRNSKIGRISRSKANRLKTIRKKFTPKITNANRDKFKWIGIQLKNPNIPDEAKNLIKKMGRGMARPYPLGDSNTKKKVWREWARYSLAQAGIDPD